MINRTLNRTRDAIRQWTNKHAEGPNAKFWLSFFSFFEASFFPIPPDTILIGILLSNEAKRWIHYALITTVASVAGGIFSYAIGLFAYDTFGQKIIDFYNMEESFLRVGELFSTNSFLAIFTAGFTPLPYKIFALASGVFKINIGILIVASFLGRGLRFFAIAYLIKCYGKYVADALYRYFNLISIVIVAIILIFVFSFV